MLTSSQSSGGLSNKDIMTRGNNSRVTGLDKHGNAIRYGGKSISSSLVVNICLLAKKSHLMDAYITHVATMKMIVYLSPQARR